jgi:hypothetical protein
MIRTKKHLSTFTSGIDRDTSFNKVQPSYIYDSQNMRLVSNDPEQSGALTNVRGNGLSLVFDVGDIILGYCKIRNNYEDKSKDSLVIFAYNNTVPTSRIYLFEGDPYSTDTTEIEMYNPFATYAATNGYQYKCGWIYANSDLNFDPNYPIKAQGRYESDQLRKVYWVDSTNTIRYMILDKVSPGDPVEIFDINPGVELHTPTTDVVAGGSYQSGIVQYSYQLYIKNGAASTFSPCSELVYLTGDDAGPDSRNFSGTDLGVNTGKAVNIHIDNLDIRYNRVRIVAIYYTEYLIDPVVNIIGELEFGTTSIDFVDNGYTIYGTIPLDEFRLFGQTNYKAGQIASKYNYLFFGDITEDIWNPAWVNPVDGNFWDSRAVRFNNADSAVVSDLQTGPITITTPSTPTSPASWDTAGWDNYVFDHDGINDFNDVSYDGSGVNEYKYQANGSTIGAEGKNVKIEFLTENILIDEVTDGNGYYSYVSAANYPTSTTEIPRVSSQRTEVYRMYIVFFNKKMQHTNPQWICDLRMPTNSEYNSCFYLYYDKTKYAQNIYPHITLRNIPADPDIYGWQVFRCERNSNDRSVLANGLLSAVDYAIWDGQYIARPYSTNVSPYAFVRAEDSLTNKTASVIEIVSPEICFNKNLTHVSGDYVRIDGRYDAHTLNKREYISNHFVTVNLGETGPVSVSETIMNLTTDGKLQSVGITSGDPIVVPPDQVIGTYTYRHCMRYLPGIYANKGTSFIATLDAPLDADPLTTGFIYGSYVRNVFASQYGGITYEARSFNSVIPYSDIVPITTTNVTCYRGDTYITMFAYLRSSVPNITLDENNIMYQEEMVYLPCESSINCFYRLDKLQKYYTPTDVVYMLQETVQQGLVLRPDTYPVELGDLYRYNTIYSKSGNGQLIQNVVFDSNNIEHSDVKIIATEKKINNEYYDSWTNIKTNNYIEVDTMYGGIKNMFNQNNKLIVCQDSAISIVAVNDRSVIQDNNKAQLTLGTGSVLERYDYLTTTSGVQNYFDVALSDKTFYYIDRKNKTIYKFTENADEPISEIKGYRSFMKSYGTIESTMTGFDPLYKNVFFYIDDGSIDHNSYFDEYVNAFIGKQTFFPDRTLSLNGQFYTFKNNNMWLHNYGDYGVFYGGTAEDSWVELVINPNGNIVNTYDSLDMRIDVYDGALYEIEQFDTIDVNNNYQSTSKSIAFSGDDSVEDTAKSVIRKWRVQLLPDDTSEDFYRFVDTYIKIKLTKENNGKRITLHDIITNYREKVN